MEVQLITQRRWRGEKIIAKLSREHFGARVITAVVHGRVRPRLFYYAPVMYVYCILYTFYVYIS